MPEVKSRYASMSSWKPAKDLGVYLYPTVIREAVAVREAQVMQESLFDSHPKAAVTADYAAFVADYLRQEGERHGD